MIERGTQSRINLVDATKMIAKKAALDRRTLTCNSCPYRRPNRARLRAWESCAH
jgi:hypothetical protein